MDSRHPKGIPSRPLVLIVDEDDDTRDLYIAGLTVFGFEAFELYCDRGREDGDDVEDWLTAERELRDALSSSAA